MDNAKFDKNLLMNTFTDISNIANIKFMFNYKTIFRKKYILKNIGFFIFCVLIVLNLFFFFLFLIKYYKKLIKEIYQIKFLLLNKIKFRQNVGNNSHLTKATKIKKFNSNNQINKINAKKCNTREKFFKSKLKINKKNKINNNHSPPKNKKNLSKTNNKKIEIKNDSRKYILDINNVNFNNFNRNIKCKKSNLITQFNMPKIKKEKIS